MYWAYGITTVPDRLYSYFPQTVQSLQRAGFNQPTIFVDGSTGDYSDYKLPVVRRSTKILAYGNWILALMELYIRHPKAQRFALFQDDFVTYNNLRPYLETCRLDDQSYWNLYTFPQNESLRPSQEVGWYKSNQRGRGAVALMFSNEVVFKLLSSPIMASKPKAATNPHRSIDGVIVTALNKVNVIEMVHYPTLVQHIGTCSSIGNRQHVKPGSFQGEGFDATSLHQFYSQVS